MPSYKFTCLACGLSESRRVAVDAKSVPCNGCKAPVRRPPPSGYSTGAKVAVTGLDPQDTGARAVDASFDETVRRDAEQKWSTIAARQRAKIEVMTREGVTGHDLRRTVEGEYEAMAPGERDASNEARELGAELRKAEAAKKP